MYAQLGNIKFEGVKGFSTLEQAFAMNYAQHERIKGKPRLEAVGSMLDTIAFTMHLHSSFTNPEEDIEAIRVNMLNKEILTLVLGNGAVVGNYVINDFTKNTTFTDPVGNLIEANISVNLLESFSDDPLRDSQKKSIENAFATSSRNSNVRSVQAPHLSRGMVVSDNVSEINSSAKVVNQYVASVDKNPQTAAYYSKKIGESLKGMEDKIAGVNDILSGSPDISALGPDMPVALNRVNTSIQNMKASLPITDINSFKDLASNLQVSTSILQISSVQVDKQAIIRRL